MNDLQLALMEKIGSFKLPTIVLLPFHIWLYTVSIPLRVLYYFVYGSKQEIKPVPQVIEPERPVQTVHRAIKDKDRIHTWFVVENKKEEVHHKKRVAKKPEEKTVESVSEEKVATPSEDFNAIKQQLALLQEREETTSQEKSKLETELADLTKRFESDEKSIHNFESERQRLRRRITEEHNKCFDYQQEIISLKNVIRKEHDILTNLQQKYHELEAKEIERQKKAHEPLLKKVPEADYVAKDVPLHAETIKTAWHIEHHERDFTEMVAEAQESETNSFSAVLKAAIGTTEQSVPKKEEVEEEFAVVGGDHSGEHIVVSTPTFVTEEEPKSSSEEVKSEEVKSEATPAEPVQHKMWHVADHHTDYTEMVAKAQENLSESIKATLPETESTSASQEKAEFTVIGGDQSSQHVYGKVSAI